MTRIGKNTLAEANDALTYPLVTSGRRYYGFVGLLLAVVSIGVYAYATQLTEGLVVTGLRSQVMWGIYVTNFVFFIGISHAGTLISAILRVTNTEWRRPITRMAEAITVLALIFGGSFIIFDLGRPDRIQNMLLYGRLDSPLIWDLISITTYLTGSILYLYLPLIPDIADLRDNLTDTSRFKRWLYTKLSMGWRGTATQKARLEKGIKIMAVIIIPIAVSVHTVVSWVFSMTLRPGWHSTIFGPYFVVGAIFSGIASIIIAMVVFRKIYRLEAYLTLQHFKYLGYMMLTLNIAYIYFTISEFFTSYYGGKPAEMMLLNSLFTGIYAPEFWTFITAGLIIPAFLIGIPQTRTIFGITLAAIFVNIGMWYKRFVIVVPALARPSMPGGEWATYTPTWVEVSITAASVAGFILLFTLFTKVFPIISMWEVREGLEKPTRSENHKVETDAREVGVRSHAADQRSTKSVEDPS